VVLTAEVQQGVGEVNVSRRHADDAEPLGAQQEVKGLLTLHLLRQHVAAKDNDNATKQHRQRARNGSVPVLQHQVDQK
jgi:hypothetical protein